MLTEPNINIKTIHSTIENNYGIKIVNLSFVQGGEASWGYKIETEDNKNFFFKIHNGLTDYEKRFELTYRLYNDCHIKNITHPIKTYKRDLVVFIENFPCALFNYISGANAFEKSLNQQQRFAFGQLLGKIHKAKETVETFSLQEDFIYGNTARLLEALKRTSTFLNDASEFKRKTADLLIKNEKRIYKRLHELEALGTQLKNQNIDFVICHGEPHKWNTMVNNEGEVFLIDWDDSLFAPKEKDLNVVKGDETILDGYQSIVGKVNLNADVIRYYILEWNISEIDAWINSLFYSNSNTIQNQHFLEQFEITLKELDK